MLPPSTMTQMGSQLPFSLAFKLVPASHVLKSQVLSRHDEPLKCEAKAGLLQHSGLQSILSHVYSLLEATQSSLRVQSALILSDRAQA